MAEYIDKDKLIDRFDELCNTICQYSKKQRAVMCSSCELGIAFDVVDDFPTEDVQPVKHGRWVFYKPPDDWIKMHLSPKSFYVCDICGHIEDGKQNYCSHCGAKMDGAE